MKDFLNVYTELIETNHEEIGKVSINYNFNFEYMIIKDKAV